ncbi:MAG TPA: sulfur globule protein precursor [Xanthobacteraceae bacterium]
MSRISVLFLAAVLALGGLSFATEASAHGGHGGGGGHFGGGHFGGGHFGGGHFGGFHRGFGGFGFGYYPYAYGGNYYGCWQLHRVLTPFGWRWRRFNACYYPYY